MNIATKAPAIEVTIEFDDLKPLASPSVRVNGFADAVPVVCYPEWDPGMGHRLMLARKCRCVLVDRRSADWRHKAANISGAKCQCLSQTELGSRLGMSQAHISKLEMGRTTVLPPSIGALLSALDSHYGILYFVLTGRNKCSIELYATMNEGEDLGRGA